MTHSTPSATPQAANFNLEELNRKYDTASPREILAWCIENIPTGFVQASAFNVDDLVITDILYRDLQRRIPVIFLDTLYHFPQSIELVAKAKDLYNLDLKTYKIPDVDTREAFAAKYGEALWDKDITQFHQGRRRDQAHTRSDMPVFELDGKQRLKVNPLASWTRKESWAYVFEHNVIYNPLHDQGYPSIGDEPITTPVAEGEDERAGRWRGTGKTECGIHI